MLAVSLFTSVKPALAQEDSASILNESAMLTSNGKLIVDGRTSHRAKIDILKDKDVLRYNVIDRPGQELVGLSVIVQLPNTVTTDQVNPRFFAVHGVGQTTINVLDQSRLAFQSYGIGEDAEITLTIDLPKGALHFTSWDRVRAIVQTLPTEDWFVVAIIGPIIILLIAGIFLLTRFADIRVQPANQAVVVPPSSLPPALVGALIHGYVGMREIGATIIDLANRGYIDIIYRSDGDFAFSKKRNWQLDKTLMAFERSFLDQLFSETVVSDVQSINQKLNKHVWSEGVSTGIENIYEQMIQLGYFKTDPKQSHLKIRFLGTVLFFLSVIGVAASLLFFADQPLAALPWLASLILSPVLLRLARITPARTEAGREQASYWLSFRGYLAAPVVAQFAEQTKEYEKQLAYAIVLGSEAEWTRRFSQLPCAVPDWFFSQGRYVTTYPELAGLLFQIIGFVSQKFSISRRPTAY